MAKEQIIGLRINIKGTKETIDKVAKIATELDTITAELKELEKAKKKPFDTTELAKFNQKIAELKSQQAALKVEQKAANKELNLQAQAFAAVGSASGSYDAVDAKLKLLRKQFKGLSDDARNGNIGQNLQKEINELDTELKGLDAGIGVFSRNVGNYEQSVIDAFKRIGNEKAIKGKLKEINENTENLILKQKQLNAELEDPKPTTNTRELIRELGLLETQIKQNEKAADNLGKALKNGTDAENLYTGTSNGKSSGRKIRKAGKLAGLGGIADLAGGAIDLQNILGGLGPVGIAAFGVFAAGGLVFKGVQALEELTAGINKTTAEVQRLSGAGTEESKKLADGIRTLSMAFGENEDAILEQVKQVQDGLGVSFPEALEKVKNGYIATAQAGGILDKTVKNQLDSSEALVNVQRELSDRFNETGISTGTLVTDIKTGLLTALITVYDAIKPLINGFITFGKTIFSVGGIFNKATGGAFSFGKVLKILSLPVKIIGTIISKVSSILAGLVQKFVDFVNDSPNIRAAFEFIGSAVDSVIGFFEKVPELIGSAIDAVGGFFRDVGSVISFGLIDDAATAAAAAQAAEVGQKMSDALVDRYGEGLKELNQETQDAIKNAGLDATINSIFDSKESFFDIKTYANALKNGTDAADKLAKENGLQVKKKNKELSEEQLKSQLEAAEKAKEARKQAADDLLKQVDDLNNQQIDSRKQFDQTISDLQKQRSDESISFIRNDFQRQSAEIESRSEAQVEAVKKTLTEANEAAQEVLKQKATLLAKNPNLGKSLGFSSQAEIKEASSQQQEIVEAEIKAQTTQIQRKRVEQLDALKVNREQLISETLRNIDNEALARIIQEQELRQEITNNEIEAQRKLGEIRIKDAEAEYQKIAQILAIQKEANIITEKEYSNTIGQIERGLAIAKLDIERQNQSELTNLEKQALDQRTISLQLQADQQQRASEQRRLQSISDIQAQAKQEIITEQQAADAINQINTNAEAQKVANAQIAAQEIAAINTEFASKEQAQIQNAAAQELEIQRQLQAEIRAERQASIDQFAQNFQNLNSAFGTVTQIGEDLFLASNNRRTQAIEAQYNREIQLANGNQALITAAEKEKDNQLQAIEKAAFKRKKKLDTTQALINGALAITNILATTPDPTGIFTAFRIAGAVATTAAQIDKIQSQEFEKGGILGQGNTIGGNIPKNGGIIQGKSHKNGGVKAKVAGKLVELEGKEIIINKNSAQKYSGLLSIINEAGGGASFAKGGILPSFSGIHKFQNGGIVPVSNQFIQSQQLQNNQAILFQKVLEAANFNAQLAINKIKVINDPKETITEGAKKITQSSQKSL